MRIFELRKMESPDPLTHLSSMKNKLTLWDLSHDLVPFNMFHLEERRAVFSKLENSRSFPEHP